MPLLVIKPPGRSGPLQTSSAPTALTDIPATVLDLLELPREGYSGESVFRIDPAAPRVRTYFFHSWKSTNWTDPYFDMLYEFSVNGPVGDPNAWKFVRTIPPP
jgi:hypothetical protein